MTATPRDGGTAAVRAASAAKVAGGAEEVARSAAGPAAGPAPRRGRPATGVREALLAATETVLAESGAARLSTKEVARRAGVAESSVFYHFGDRVGLLLAAVWEYLPPVKELFFDEERGRSASLRSNLVALFDALEAFFLRTVPVIAAVQADGQLRAAFVERSRDLGLGPHRAIEGTMAFLAAEQRAGRLARDGVDLRAAAMLLVGGAYQRAFQQHLGAPDAPNWLASSGESVDLLMRGLVARGDGTATGKTATAPAPG